MSGNNTYDGGTALSGGTVRVTDDTNLGTGNIAFNEGTLEAADTFVSGKWVVLARQGTFDVNPDKTLTLTGNLMGPGALEKTNTGTLVLSGTNIYRGGTVLSGGTVRVTDDSQLGRNAITFNGGSLEAAETFASEKSIVLSGGGTINVDPSKTLTLAGDITGPGALQKTNAGTLVLNGANTYTGGTTVAEGVLRGNTESLQGDIVNNATLVFEQITNGTYAQTLSGSGALVKDRSGDLLLIADSHSFQGTVTVQNGKLKSLGHLAGVDLQVAPNARFGGNSSVGSVTNGGIVSPGASIGIMHINNNYVQLSTGQLLIELNGEGESSLLEVDGTAEIDGTLALELHPGVYLNGTTYTVLTAGGGVSGTFSQLIEDHPLAFGFRYSGNFVQIIASTDSLIVPGDLNNVKGNAISVANYMFCTSFPYSNVDLVNITDLLFNLPFDEFSSALKRFSPAQFGGLALAGLENNSRIGNTFLDDLNNEFCSQRSCYKDGENVSKTGSNTAWLYPIFFDYQQKTRQEGDGFHMRTEGGSLGVNHTFPSCTIVGGGFGYSHSNLHWVHNAGKASWNSVYAAPYVSYHPRNGYINLLLQGACNFYDVTRKIKFPGFSREASNHHKSWDLLAKLQSGLNLPFHSHKSFYVQPHVMVDYLNIFEEGYREKGANSLDLAVKHKHSAFLRYLTALKTTKEWKFDEQCLAIDLDIGWLGTTPLTSGKYTSDFYKEQLCQDDFTVNSFHQTVNQLSIGADLLYSLRNDFDLTLGYQGDFGQGTKVNEAKLSLQYHF